MTVCSAVWSAATRCIAVTTMSRALSWASSRAARSMARASLTASCSASSRTPRGARAFASSARHARRRARGRRPAPGCARASSSRVLSSSRSRSSELAVALLEHVRALVELLVALEQAALQAGQLVAPGAGLVLGLALEAQLLVLRLEDELLLAGARLGLDAAGFGLRGLHRLRCPHAADEHAEYGSADGGHEGHRHQDRCVHRCPPIRTGSCGRTRLCRSSVASSATAGTA